MLEQIKKKRAEEIAQGKNLCTRNPLYVVYNVKHMIIEANSSYDQSTSRFGLKTEYLRVCEDDSEVFIEVFPTDLDFDEYEVQREDEDGEPRMYGEVLKKMWYDWFVACFFTHEAAEAFIEADRHNLTNPRIYVEYIHHKNTQLLGLLGEK